jgi:hypothetical protein
MGGSCNLPQDFRNAYAIVVRKLHGNKRDIYTGGRMMLPSVLTEVSCMSVSLMELVESFIVVIMKIQVK